MFPRSPAPYAEWGKAMETGTRLTMIAVFDHHVVGHWPPATRPSFGNNQESECRLRPPTIRPITEPPLQKSAIFSSAVRTTAPHDQRRGASLAKSFAGQECR